MFEEMNISVDKFYKDCETTIKKLKTFERKKEFDQAMKQRKSNKIAIRKAKLKMTSMGGYTRT